MARFPNPGKKLPRLIALNDGVSEWEPERHTIESAQGGDLEAGDIDEAFTAAEAVGDDRLQREATGTVRPDTFTHGTSAQRHNWFNVGYASGRPEDCDTFSGDI